MIGRAAMRDALPLDPARPTKTYVLEAHTDDPGGYLADLVGEENIEQTADASVSVVHIGVDEDAFWVDQLDPRFWSFHTDMRTDVAHQYLHERVERRRDLDWIWLPSGHLRRLGPPGSARHIRTNFAGADLLGPGVDTASLQIRASGMVADDVLGYLEDRYRSSVSLQAIRVVLDDPDGGPLTENVTRMGRFGATGDGFEDHAQFVGDVVSHYARLVRLLEDRALRWTAFDAEATEGGGRLAGRPIEIGFSRPVPDVARFVEHLFSARRPFRLWGMYELVDGVAEVEAVDLHVGQPLRLDIGERWMRIYLAQGCCGNTVARLVSNLQHRFDGALHFGDPELDAALSG